MQLMMYIGNDLIEAINLDAARISKRGYLGQFKRTLKMKYRELIQQADDKLDFLVVAPNQPSQLQMQYAEIKNGSTHQL